MVERLDLLLAVGGNTGAIPVRRRRHRRLHWDSARLACTMALAASDVLALLLSAMAAWVVARGGELSGSMHSGYAPTSEGALMLGVEFAFILTGLIGYFGASGHYHRRLPFWSELQQVLLGAVFALLCNSFLEFAFKTNASRVMVLGTWMAFPLMLLLLRHTTRRLLSDAGVWQIRTIIVGGGETARMAAGALLSEPGLGYSVIGIVSPASLGQAPSGRRWVRIMQQFDAHLLVIAPEPSQALDRSLNEALIREKVPFAMMPQVEGLPVSGRVQTYFPSHDVIMLSYRRNIARPVARAVKVAMDLFVASALVVVVSPVLLVIACAVKFDGGPIFYAHRRIGAADRRFACLKFRSMRQDSAEVLAHVLQTDPAASAEWAATQKLRNDPRITRVGALLRKTSLDELPQLFNVLRLEMSLVGPRPIVEGEIAHYGDAIAYYHETRPGITGLWQVSGRSDTTYQQRVALDTWYVKNWTLWNDIAILLKTVPAVLARKGAV